MIAIGVAAVVALAFVVEGALGFGATVVALSFGAFLLPVDQLLPVLLPLNIALSSALVWIGARFIDKALLWKRIVPLMALGAPVGFFGLAAIPAATATRVFGIVVVTLAVLALVRRRAFPSWAGPGLFLAAGAVHGAFGTGGPLVVAGLAARDKAVMRATLSALWLLLNLALFAAFAIDGRFDERSVSLLLPAAVGAVIGGILGAKLHDRIDGSRFARVVWGALLFTGALLALR